MKNKIEDLRNHLFEAIEMVKSGDLDVARAKTINEIGQTLINSAKVEIEFIKATDRATGSAFIDAESRNELPALERPLKAVR